MLDPVGIFICNTMHGSISDTDWTQMQSKFEHTGWGGEEKEAPFTEEQELASPVKAFKPHMDWFNHVPSKKFIKKNKKAIQIVN